MKISVSLWQILFMIIYGTIYGNSCLIYCLTTDYTDYSNLLMSIYALRMTTIRLFMAIYVHLQFSLQNKKEQADFASSQHLKKKHSLQRM